MDFTIKLTFFLLALPDGIVGQKFGFQFKKGSPKKISMSEASMNR